MFKWLRDKVMKGSEEEFNKGLDRNTNFLEFAKSFSNNTPEVNDIIYALESDNMMLWTAGYNDKSMSKLLDVDMNCRRLFANVYGGSDYGEHANKEIITMAMIETQQAVENLDSILSVEGLDSIYIGPADLSLSYTHKPSFDIINPPVKDVIELILSKAKKHNIVAGIHTGSTEYAHKMIQLGFQFVTILSESKILSVAVEEILRDMKKDQSKKNNNIKTTY